MNVELLAYEAKSFYNAYINLERMDLQCEDLLFSIPRMVNGAFSIELSLKALLSNLNIHFEREHNLFVLFSMLPERIQELFWKYLTLKAPEYDDEDKRTEELLLISDSFVKWRYFYEDNVVPAFDSRFLSAFANTAIYFLLALGFNFDIKKTEEIIETDEQIEKLISENRAKSIQSTKDYIEKKEQKKKELPSDD